MKKFTNILSFIKQRLLYPACLYTVLIATFFLLLAISDIEPSITMGIFLSVFCFSLMIALSNLLLHNKKLHAVPRYMIHYIINLAAFIVFWHLCYPQSIAAQTNEWNFLTGNFIWEINARQFIFGICLYTLVYIIIVGVNAAIRAFASSEKQSEEEYDSIF